MNDERWLLPEGIDEVLPPEAWQLEAVKTNTITTTTSLTAPGVLLGHAMNGTGTAITELGRVNNFNTDGLVVGGRRAGSTFLRFGLANSNGAAPGNFTLRGSAGGATPASVLSIGDAAANADGYSTAFLGSTASAIGTADFSGAPVGILADSIYIGRGLPCHPDSQRHRQWHPHRRTRHRHRGQCHIAYKPPGSTNTSIGQGTLILRGHAVMNVMKDVALVYRTNGTASISE